MANPVASVNTGRINFSSTFVKTDYPDFLDIQLKAFHDFFSNRYEAGGPKR